MTGCCGGLLMVLFWATAMNEGHLQQLAMCSSFQLAHLSSVSRVLVHNMVLQFSSHLIHFRGCPQFLNECLNPWYWKNWDGLLVLYDSTMTEIQNREASSKIRLLFWFHGRFIIKTGRFRPSLINQQMDLVINPSSTISSLTLDSS